MNRKLGLAAFVLGLMAIAWVGYGYLTTNPLALTMTLLIGAFYLAGGLELQRFQRATSALEAALAAVPEHLTHLGEWLQQLPPSLQNPVRLRVEGERHGLPGPVMTPYLVGLLVILGMLGTFLGMVVTLNGAVRALESSTDLATIRAALAAPVKGLGLAFGTSVAGVAASAMLGLVSALCRRERLQAAQQLDTRIATTLRAFSRAHQRAETLQALQTQARVLPAVVDQLQTAMAQMAQQHQALSERLLDGQDRFHRQAQTAYTDLARSVDRSLQDSLSASARLAGETLQPLVEATMGGIARETAQLQAHLATSVAQQLEGLSARFGSTVDTVSQVWTRAVAEHERSSTALAQGLAGTLTGQAEALGQRTTALLAALDERQAALHGGWQASVADLAQQTAALHARLAGDSAHTLAAMTAAFEQRSTAMTEAFEQRSAAMTETFDQRSAAWVAQAAQAQTTAQAQQAAQDEQRLAAMARQLEGLAAALQQAWQQAGAQSLDQQAQICQTLEQTAGRLQAQAEAQARHTIAEVTRLMQTAGEAPQAVAEMVGVLRQQLSDSLVRDNGVLEERSRIMATLGTLLDTVNHAATEQRGAIDALVSASADLLHQAGTRFSAQVEAESEKLSEAAAQITGSAVDVASLGEAFGHAVQRFGASSEGLVAQLQRIEAALGKSTARSDEQLAYYVAQAREIIDLSLTSQQQIVEQLQQVSRRPAALASEVA